MVDVAPRGLGQTEFREVRCKDCLREQLLASNRNGTPEAAQFEYSEAWATRMLDRGGSRTDRCARHRKEHREAIQGIAVAYIDLETIGEVRDRSRPTGPLGGLGELPSTHAPKKTVVDLSKRKFGMTDDDIREALRKLANPEKRVLVLKAGTGTGKSTFGPYRLMNPPSDQPGDKDLFKLTKRGPIIVTEPRVQATTGVARFVGEKLVAGCPWKVCSLHGRFVPAKDANPERPEGPNHPGPETTECKISDCVDHIGPGYPVGYQVKDDRKHDDSCQLIYVTDGTMVNWLSGGRLSGIGAVIVDEAHERSQNIDYIMGELKRQLDRYPHLRVIVTSATFEIDYWVSFFGGPDRVEWMDVPAQKEFGYGAPLFPYSSEEDAVPPCPCARHDPAKGREQPHPDGDPTNYETWLATHWPNRFGPSVADRPPDDLQETTRLLEKLRYDGPAIDPNEWGLQMQSAVVHQVVRMVQGLHDMKIYGDILAFLPTEKMITKAVGAIEAALDSVPVDVFGLLGTMPKERQAEALAARPPDARRKVVVATNVAETSLTVEGVRFVVDSGIIMQPTWDPVAASSRPGTRPHSQAGVRQRWGRVGRDAPGWVFPIYREDQFSKLDQETPPASTRENLERLIMTAIAGGVDVEDLEDFPWPAAHEVAIQDGAVAIQADDVPTSRERFIRERKRAVHALELDGIVANGSFTTFGKEVQQFAASGATVATAQAVMLADQLACVPEVATALRLLDDTHSFALNKLFIDDREWSSDMKIEAKLRRDALYLECRDDLDLILRVTAGWDLADPERPPWELTAARRRWCEYWWLNEEVLSTAAEARRETLASLSPIMNEEVKRFIDPRLAERARAVISRAMTSLQYVKGDDERYTSVADPAAPSAVFDGNAFPVGKPDRVVAFSRFRRVRESGEIIYLKNLVQVVPWASEKDLDAFELLERASHHASPRVLRNRGEDRMLPLIVSWPVGMRFKASLRKIDGHTFINDVQRIYPPIPTDDSAASGDADEDASANAESEPRSKESNWSLGIQTPDEEQLSQLPQDTADDPDDPTIGLETNDDASTAVLVPHDDPVDVLTDWRAVASLTNLDHPRVSVDRNSSKPREYGCFGYDVRKNGELSLRLTSGFAAIQVDVRDDKRGAVIGGGGRGNNNISAIESLPGVLSCDFGGNRPLRLVAASSGALKDALGIFDKSHGLMRMPDPKFGGRLKREGSRLRDASGCTWAHLCEDGVTWELDGPSDDSIHMFIELANAVVPGCTGHLVTADWMVIRDMVAEREIDDWRRHKFAVASVREWPQVPRRWAQANFDEDDFDEDDGDGELDDQVAVPRRPSDAAGRSAVRSAVVSRHRRRRRGRTVFALALIVALSYLGFRGWKAYEWRPQAASVSQMCQATEFVVYPESRQQALLSRGAQLWFFHNGGFISEATRPAPKGSLIYAEAARLPFLAAQQRLYCHTK